MRIGCWRCRRPAMQRRDAVDRRRASRLPWAACRWPRCWAAAPNRSELIQVSEPGSFGSYYRTVKTVLSQGVPGGRCHRPSGCRGSVPFDRELPRRLDSRPSASESVLAATGIGAGASWRVRRQHCAFGSGMAAITGESAGAGLQASVSGRARRQFTTRFTRYALEYLAPQGITFRRGTQATRCTTRPSTRTWCSPKHRPNFRTRRHRPASAVADLPQPGISVSSLVWLGDKYPLPIGGTINPPIILSALITDC